VEEIQRPDLSIAGTAYLAELIFKIAEARRAFSVIDLDRRTRSPVGSFEVGEALEKVTAVLKSRSRKQPGS